MHSILDGSFRRWVPSYGVVRESFAELSLETGGFDFRQPAGRQPADKQPGGSFDPEAFDPDSFGGRLSALDNLLVSTGLTLGLLPTEKELTTEHRRENARSAVFGFLLLISGMLLPQAVKVGQEIVRLALRLYGGAASIAKRRAARAVRWLHQMFSRPGG